MILPQHVYCSDTGNGDSVSPRTGSPEFHIAHRGTWIVVQWAAAAGFVDLEHHSGVATVRYHLAAKQMSGSLMNVSP